VQQIFFGPRDGCVLDVGNAKSLSKRRPFGKLFRASGELARKASSSPQRSPLIVSLTSRPKVPPIKPVVPTRSASEPAANYPAAELELPPAPRLALSAFVRSGKPLSLAPASSILGVDDAFPSRKPLHIALPVARSRAE